MNYISCLFIFFLCATNTMAQDAIYDELTQRVLIPSVRVGDEFFARVVLQLDENDRFFLTRSDKASEEENAFLTRIDQSNCFNAHPVAKLQAVEYFGDSEKSICFRFAQGTGTEGGAVVQYLLIESGVATLINDNRDIGFSVCCLEIFDNVTNILAGQIVNGSFVPWMQNDPIDINGNYVLRVEISGTFQTDL